MHQNFVKLNNFNQKWYDGHNGTSTKLAEKVLHPLESLRPAGCRLQVLVYDPSEPHCSPLPVLIEAAGIEVYTELIQLLTGGENS